MTSRW